MPLAAYQRLAANPTIHVQMRLLGSTDQIVATDFFTTEVWTCRRRIGESHIDSERSKVCPISGNKATSGVVQNECEGEKCCTDTMNSEVAG